MMAGKSVLFIILCTWTFCDLSFRLVKADSQDNYDELFQDAYGICKLRKYHAERHHVTTSDGYILSLIRCTNPLINGGRSGARNKDVILFVHGILTDANAFVISSSNARPRDYSRYNASAMSEASIQKLLAKDPSRFNLPMLSMNFAHEVWLLNRRGARGSRKRIRKGARSKREQITPSQRAIGGLQIPEFLNSILSGLAELTGKVLPGLDPDFWDYSLDEQAKYDLPQTIDYILKRTGRKKLALVTHSAGGAIALMSLSREPKLAKKISKAIFWAPAVNLGHSLRESILFPLVGLITDYNGAFLPLPLENILMSLLPVICSTPLTQRTICMTLSDLIFGAATSNERLRPGFFASFPISVAAKEITHVTQSVNLNSTRHFDFNDAEENREVYGSPIPPAYNFSAITLKGMSFFAGNTDGLVSYADVRVTRSQLSVPSTSRLLAQNDKFNHIGYFANANASSTVLIPSLVLLESNPVV